MAKTPDTRVEKNELFERPAKKQPTSNISDKLRTFYDSVRDETIPDRFLDLLEKLDDVEQAAGGRNKK